MDFWTPYGKQLALPMICAPQFIVSGPELVLAQCKAGVVGSFPALNARTTDILDSWLTNIAVELAKHDAEHPGRPSAPYAVNLIVHRSNAQLEAQLAVCVKHKVPIIITSLGARPEVNDAVHSYGGIVLHDVINLVHAHKAIDKGADGLIAVAVGAGGHAGLLSPFALIGEIREWWKGPLMLSGAMSTGQAVLSAQVMGADLAYCGSCFIPSQEANADPEYKAMIVEATAADIIYTDKVSGTPSNFIRQSLAKAGIDINGERPGADYGNLMDSAKAWRDIWSAGQGVGVIHEQRPVREIVGRLVEEYEAAVSKVALIRELRQAA